MPRRKTIWCDCLSRFLLPLLFTLGNTHVVLAVPTPGTSSFAAVSNADDDHRASVIVGSNQTAADDTRGDANAGGVPTPTPSGAPCVGDCNSAGSVTVNELVILVNIALGNAPISTCTAGDASNDGAITIDEILVAVDNALYGCAPSPTPSDVPRPCSSSDRTCYVSVNGSDADSGAAPAHALRTITRAVQLALANYTIIVAPGTYRESPAEPTAVTVSKDGIQLIGESTPDNPVVLENLGGQKNGIWVSPADSVNTTRGEFPPCGANGNLLHSFVLRGFTVRNFDEYGVYLACVDGFTLSENLADGDRVYGLFPVRSHNGTMSNNEARGSSLDSALYVGQSDHVTMTGNRAYGNVQGLEVENSTDVTVTNNDVFSNTVGMIVDIRPGLQKTDQTNVLIADNAVHDNNRPLTRPAPPRGTGILVIGGSQVTVQNNMISNNGFAGILMTRFCSAVWSDEQQCTNIDIDPNPENNRVVDNQLSHNGTMPPADPILAQVAADLAWDNTGMGNCWGGNTPLATVKVLGGGQTLPICQ